MSITTIFLTRHGQTEWNVQHRMQGHMDSELTALGVQQAEWLSRGMRTEQLDVIYASPSPRALRTAEIIRGERSTPLKTSEAFKEIGMGVWEGRDSNELESEYSEQHRNFWQDPEQFKVEGSETFAEVQARALGKLQEILVDHQGETILIVTHTVVIKLLMAYFEGRALPKLWDLPYIYPTCLCRVDFTDGVPEILLHGDTSHYEESEAGMES
ncbi:MULTISPECIES: histidine phosphatase family protein [Paenibacillus]|uniref:histidine phosphatase family protein n=1 Tax=Paenibacillus TaxID=44249 RepID=UPI00096DB8E8|nr:histidine phosphatase family protein [Paenibacillus odorifer]OMD12043.1 histidine phosphatase family protein [Paenibacillus odorifer]OZQ75860.1 histidine phosphatase family protein [Paenibacillus odorifer]